MCCGIWRLRAFILCHEMRERRKAPAILSLPSAIQRSGNHRCPLVRSHWRSVFRSAIYESLHTRPRCARFPARPQPPPPPSNCGLFGQQPANFRNVPPRRIQPNQKWKLDDGIASLPGSKYICCGAVHSRTGGSHSPSRVRRAYSTENVRPCAAPATGKDHGPNSAMFQSIRESCPNGSLRCPSGRMPAEGSDPNRQWKTAAPAVRAHIPYRKGN
jgi:hypothetical protein